MSGADLRAALGEVKPGANLGPITLKRPGMTMSGVVVSTLCELKEGVAPASSGLISKHTDLYVATDVERGNPEVNLALQDIDHGRATIGIQPVMREVER